MADYTIFHNPRCSKSRQALALLEEHGVSPAIMLYLQTPPSIAEINALLKKLNLPARELLRTKEDAYRDLGLADVSLSDAALIKAMHENPKLIERPIVIQGEKAVIGRPPEAVLELIR